MGINKHFQIFFLATVTVLATGIGYTVSAAIQENEHTALTRSMVPYTIATPAVTQSGNAMQFNMQVACIAPTVGVCQAPCIPEAI